MWGPPMHEKVADLDAIVKRYAVVYHCCRKQMVALEAKPRILDFYKVLAKKDLTVSTVVSDPNARGHCHDSLAWFWTMDIPKDTDKNDWMSECKLFHIPFRIIIPTSLPCPLAAGKGKARQMD